MKRKATSVYEALRVVVVLAVAAVVGIAGWTQYVNAQGPQGAPGGQGAPQGQPPQGGPGGGGGRGGRGGGGGAPGGGRGAGGGGGAAPDIHVMPVQGNVYMIVGAGGNITMQIGKEEEADLPTGVTLVDTGLAQDADAVLAAIRTVTDLPIRDIIYTHIHPDHVGGGSVLGNSGTTVVAGNFAGMGPRGATIIANLSVLDKMSAPAAGQTGPNAQPAFPQDSWPTDTFEGPVKNYYINGEAVQLFHPANAHTDGDLMVFFRKSDVISTGDVFVTNGYPVIDLNNGGTFPGILAALNQVIDIAVPRAKQEAGTYVIPGHGRLCDVADVVFYQEMLTIIRDRMQDAISKGMTLEQVKQANLTRDYDPEYGATSGFWTTDNFIDAAYKTLSDSLKQSKK